MTPERSSLAISKALVVDRKISPRVRVRSWSHAQATTVTGRAAAHDGLEIGWLVRGSVEYRVGRNAFAVTDGEVAVVPAYVEHVTVFRSDVEAGAIWIADDFVDEIADACGSSPRALREAGRRDPGRALALGRELEEEARLDGPGQILAVEALTEALIVRLLRAAPAAPGPNVRDRRLRAALEMLDARFSEPVDVEAMARAASMSRFHFSRAFREVTGRSPYAYLVELRVRRAAELLRGGHHSVTESAFAVGFQDLGRFARAFRKTMGCSPSQLLRGATVKADPDLRARSSARPRRAS